MGAWAWALALVRQIARHHGGDVRCVPRHGGGTCFEVTLTLSQALAKRREVAGVLDYRPGNCRAQHLRPERRAIVTCRPTGIISSFTQVSGMLYADVAAPQSPSLVDMLLLPAGFVVIFYFFI